MKMFELASLTPAEVEALTRRAAFASGDTDGVVRTICSEIKQRGDEAVREYSARFDGFSPNDLRIPQSAMDQAAEALSSDLRIAIRTAATNIRTFHEAQLRKRELVETMPGVTCWRERRAIERVGLYVPAGSAPLPSTVMMLGIPAMIVGCSRIVLCTPPRKDGTVDPAILFAAGSIGIDECYYAGGAQAIAAMAYGTESIPKVDKIFGPGNRYVTAAKQIVSSDPYGAAIDMLAGPSELLVIADDSAKAEVVTADLLSQAEHDPDSQVVLVTTSRTLAEKVLALLPQQASMLPRKSIVDKALENSYILITNSLEEMIDFSNRYASEHLSIQVVNEEDVLPRIQNAGSVFVGSYAPITAGDYASGTNHTLPTSGTARFFSGVSVESFQKNITFQRLTQEGLRSLAPTLKILASAEGLDAHKRAVEVREAR